MFCRSINSLIFKTYFCNNYLGLEGLKNIYIYQILHILHIFWSFTLNYSEIINWHLSKYRVMYLLITFALSALQVITSDHHSHSTEKSSFDCIIK